MDCQEAWTQHFGFSRQDSFSAYMYPFPFPLVIIIWFFVWAIVIYLWYYLSNSMGCGSGWISLFFLLIHSMFVLYCRPLTMHLCQLQLRLLSHTFLLSASICRYMHYCGSSVCCLCQSSIWLLDTSKYIEINGEKNKLCLSLHFPFGSLAILISLAALFMRLTSILTKAPFIMVPLKLLRPAVSSALSLSSLSPLESPLLSSLVYGFMVKWSNYPR